MIDPYVRIRARRIILSAAFYFFAFFNSKIVIFSRDPASWIAVLPDLFERAF